jgi:uncharacterized protein YjbI with pentapeptide repeats
MVEPEHLKLLEQGVTAWNAWRAATRSVIPDLGGAELSNLNLEGVNLSGANLRETNFFDTNLQQANLSGANLFHASLDGANLRGADLSGANLREARISQWDDGKRLADLGSANLSDADLRGADLRKANLGLANLSKANLSRANLSGANLSGADLKGVDLSRAIVNEADFSNAVIYQTYFVDIDLSNVSGLESIDHRGPSTIGIDTIYRSGGKIPHKFLKDAGVPDIFIEYMGSLTAQAFQYYSCFISYSNNDKDFADRIHADLRNEGVRCWFAHEDLKIGDEIRPAIEKEIRLRDKVLLVLSESSINSEWVKDEVEAAYEEEKLRKKTVLFPIRTDQSVMETEKAWAAKLRRQRNIGDFTNWKDHDSYLQAFKRLLRDLQATEK